MKLLEENTGKKKKNPDAGLREWYSGDLKHKQQD